MWHALYKSVPILFSYFFYKKNHKIKNFICKEIRGVHCTPLENPKKVSQVTHVLFELDWFWEIETCNKPIKNSHCGGSGPPQWDSWQVYCKVWHHFLSTIELCASSRLHGRKFRRLRGFNAGPGEGFVGVQSLKPMGNPHWLLDYLFLGFSKASSRALNSPIVTKYPVRSTNSFKLQVQRGLIKRRHSLTSMIFEATHSKGSFNDLTLTCNIPIWSLRVLCQYPQSHTLHWKHAGLVNFLILGKFL